MSSPDMNEPASGKPTVLGLEPLLIGAKHAARMLSISERKLRQMTAELEVPSLKCGRRTLYSVDALRVWIQSNLTKVD